MPNEIPMETEAFRWEFGGFCPEISKFFFLNQSIRSPGRNKKKKSMKSQSKILFAINSFSPAGLTENLGSYYFLPKLSILLNIDVEPLAVFFYSLIVILSYLSFLIASF